jgi:hypothetical protein
MPYSNGDTILLYSSDANIIKIAEAFAKEKSLQIFYADSESDLIAVPNLFILTDINILNKYAFDYIDNLVYEKLIEEQIFITYNNPISEISIKYSKYFKAIENISIKDLDSILNSVGRFEWWKIFLGQVNP